MLLLKVVPNGNTKIGVEDIEGLSSPSQDFSVTASGTREANELKV